ncbi:unnamed protein product [Amaranthus hypochondriacus]
MLDRELEDKEDGAEAVVMKGTTSGVSESHDKGDSSEKNNSHVGSLEATKADFVEIIDPCTMSVEPSKDSFHPPTNVSNTSTSSHTSRRIQKWKQLHRNTVQSGGKKKHGGGLQG